MGYFFSIFIGTFILEDVALVSSIALMAEHKMSFVAAFLACFIGISLGDLGLYLLGYAANYFGNEKGFKFFTKYKSSLEAMKTSQILSYSIVISRVLPGTRIPTYVGAGFVRYPFWLFFVLTILSVAGWVLLAILSGQTLNFIFADHWLLTLLFYILFLNTVKTLFPKLADFWQRKTLKYSWQKWTQFEFWPALFFYLPIVPIYIYLSIKYRSVWMPFYACPHMANGGLIGESKWDFLKHLSANEASTLKAVKVGKEMDFIQATELLAIAKLEYPLIIKPDVGQRGFGVRIVRDDIELRDYLRQSNFDRIVQRLSLYPNEAGVFYVRKPSEQMGHIFSLTDKKFPFVIGDGKTALGDLILQDSRARIIASVYFERLKDSLNTVPALNEKIQISECGNHCQGAIFLNGELLITDALTKELDRITRQIPDFYFGRFDVRYQDVESFKQGKNFEIVEVNGAGSEATHIWDAKTKLVDAYLTLFKQWSLLFAIGDEVTHLLKKKTKFTVRGFLKECYKVAFRKESLSVSS